MSAPGDRCTGLSWTIDAWGNRTDQTVTGGTCNTFHQAVNANNQLSGSPYVYDAAGNMTHDASHSYTYDAENNLMAVDGGNTATYVYDPDRRVQKTAGGVLTQYIYDMSGNIIAEYGGGCGTTCWHTGYVYVNGQLKAEYENATTYFVHGDHLVSTRLLTGYPSASIVECDDYYPFGELISCGSTTTTTHKFTAKERDSESNLDNFGARYNSSSMGRFMSPDPDGAGAVDTDPQTWNAYAYVRNNPLVSVDPTGRDHCNYYANNGVDVEFRDAHSSSDECDANGGTWVVGNEIDANQRDTSEPSLSPFDLPGQFFVGFGDLTLNNNPRGLARMAYAIGADLGGAAILDGVINLAGRVFSPTTEAIRDLSPEAGVIRLKSVNLPAWRTIAVDMDEIASGHMAGGSRAVQSGIKSLFPEGMSEGQVESVVRQAYRYGEKIGSQGDRVLIQGQGNGLTIQMWVNTVTRRIETAYPVWW